MATSVNRAELPAGGSLTTHSTLKPPNPATRAGTNPIAGPTPGSQIITTLAPIPERHRRPGVVVAA